jgi:hypothetical protein
MASLFTAIRRSADRKVSWAVIRNGTEWSVHQWQTAPVERFGWVAGIESDGTHEDMKAARKTQIAEAESRRAQYDKDGTLTW